MNKTVLNNYKSFEACEFSIKSTKNGTKYICIYRPPPSKKNKLKPSMFISEFCGHLVFLGDFNLHFDSEVEFYAQTMKTCLHNRNLIQLVNKPTQVKNHILDWVIVRDDDILVQNIDVSDKCLSDHYVISFTVNGSKPLAI